MTPLRQAASIIIALAMPSLAAAVQMEGFPTEPAFQADRVYQVSNPDSIDLSTGSLTLTIPIGGSYPVGGDFSYGLILSYSSLIWDFDVRVEGLPDCDPPNDPCEWFRQAFPSRRSNAGIGWRLSLGELYSPVDPDSPWDTDWAYVSPDGSEHVFFETLHPRDAPSSYGGYSYWYSRDGSYLRMKFQSSPPAYESRWIEHPDGTIHTFEEDASYPNRYRLTRIEDRHGNYLNIGYVGSPVTQWTLTDRHGRQHHVHFTGRMSDSEPVRYVSSVELEAFGGATATYSFTYASTTIDRSLKDSDPETSLTTSVPLLTRIDLPDGTSYSMPVLSSYHTTATRDLRDLPGVIKKVVLPTLGSVEWTWQRWWTPGVEWIYPDTSPVVGPEAVEFCRDWVGVEEKIYWDRSGSGLGTWSYTTWTGVAIPNGPADLHTERRTVVTSPELDDTVYYFRALPADGGLDGQYHSEIIMWDYALPYTRRTSVSDPKTGLPLYLSVEYYDGAANYNATPVTGSKKRSEYVRYENSHFNEHLVTGWDFNYRHLTRHRAASRTTYDDDGGKYRQITSFDFDGLGHHRTTVTDGNLGGAVRHKSFTNLNPGQGTYKARTPDAGDPASSDWYTVFGGVESPADSFTMWPAASAWVIGTSTYAEEFEEDDDGVVTYGRSDTCYDAATGKLLRSRRLKDTTHPGGFNANDVLTVNVFNGYGDLTGRRSYGADLQSIATTALCGMALPASTQARSDLTYQYGSMATATPMTAAGAAMSFKLLDRDIDLSTGLPSRSRDSSGLPTEYVFDSSGRLTWIKPTGQAPGGGTVTRGAWVQHCYFNAAGSAPAEVEVTMRPNGLTPTCTDSQNVLARSSYTYDDLGRLAGEYTLLPGAVWNQRLHGYNAMGWKLWQTEWQLEGAATLKTTTFSNFDPFGRPLTITPPDGSAHNVTIAYTGERRVQRTVKVGTSRTGSVVNETSVTTTHLYDGVGHLWKRTEPSSPGGTDVTTIYTYDALGRLRNASTTSGVTQDRDWSYDGRGFLLSEVVPEKGGTGGYGTVSYSSYDVRGQAGRVIDGPNDLSSLFDDAGRLTSVTETGTGKVVRSLTYGTANTSGNLANGKLTIAEAGNFYDGTNNFQFRDTSTYGGTDGRVSQRVTLGGLEGVNQGTFTLGYTWSPLGDVATVTYPQKAGVGSARTVTNTYTNGFLTKVAQGATNYASAISYHTNATVNRVTYGNNVWVDHAKDPNDMARPSQITLGNATSAWDTGSYSFDGAGNIITMTGTSTTDTFVYDKVSRIKEARQTVGGVLKTQSYAYDTFGNLTTITTNGTPRTVAVDALTNRISGSGYDAAGSMTSWGDGGTTYSYAYYPTNEMKQMVGDGRTTLFGYSADGERVGTWDSVAGGITYVLRGLDNKPLRQYREYNGGWTWQKDWIWRDGLLLATIDSSGTKYFHPDHLGTPRRITNSSRAVIASHDYYPFGEEITASSQDSEALKFTGHERDLRDPTKTTDDLDYMHARFYNPWIGRFLSTDPIGGTPVAPQSWNRYSYVRNNPVNAVDPTGEFIALPIAIAGGKAAWAAGAALTAATVAWWNAPAPGNPSVSNGQVVIQTGGEALQGVSNAIGGMFNENTQDARVRGRENEAKVLDDMGLDKNTETVSGTEGNSIPDAQTDTSVVEIKDSSSVSRTRQIRIQQEAAAESGRDHVVVTGAKTKVTKPLDQTSTVVRRPDIGPQ
ncbi:MAG TPA: RHS repeat-associated core domain-containing protein [Thermoanaerobaculales bacterium]|nr:RHS repeat-associated core domain-containing protein [Thermoanaerobaculales bacterium]